MQTFGFSPSTRSGVGLLATLIGILVLIIYLFIVFAPPTTWVNVALLSLSALLLGLFTLSVRFYFRTYDQISVSKEGLTYLPRAGNPRSVSWDEIAGIKPHTLRNRYDVVNRQGQRLLAISYELDRLEELVEIIRKHLQRVSQDQHLLYQINRSAGMIILWLCVMAVFALLFMDLTPRLIYGMLITLFLVPWTLFFELRCVRIDSRGLVFEYLCRRFLLPYREVKGVSIEGEWVPSLRYVTIRIERNGMKPFRFGWSGDEGRILCKTIEEHWRANNQGTQVSS